MEVYLDNSATTRPYKECVDLMADILYNRYGNPSSLHRRGIEAEKVVKIAREQVAKSIKARPDEIYFTSGGTEGDNLAIIGTCGASRGRHIISTEIEHPAILNTLEHMKALGYVVDLLPVDKEGRVELDVLEKMIRDDTVIVSSMYVNNEIGTVQPVEKMAEIIKQKNPNTYFHIDAVQAYGKIPFTVESTGADMITLSSHKIHGPKGMGALYIKNRTKIAPVIFGGGQQGNIRPGTENVPGIAGFGLAAEISSTRIAEKIEKMRTLKEKLKKGILESIPDVYINSPSENTAPHILNVAFENVRSEVLLHSLEDEEIYVSSGSACSSHKKAPSYVLLAIGADKKAIDGSIRFSLSEFTSEEEIDKVLCILPEKVAGIRKIMKK